MLPPEGRHFQPHSCVAGQAGMQELKVLNEAELRNLQAIKQELLDPLGNQLLHLLTTSLIVIVRVHFWGFHARASYYSFCG